ncbi:MAG: NusG domain II-containing protein [Collinsella sp.]|nr:NusG domain II-containing protein [Collinsella sp.]
MAFQLKPGDRLLIGLLSLALLGGAAWWLLGEGAPTGGLVVVCQSKDGFRRVDALSTSVEYTVETPGTGFGADAQEGLNTVRIEGGAVDVISSNCANQICAEHDAISEAGEQIVCLPHGVVIEIVDDEENASQLV